MSRIFGVIGASMAALAGSGTWLNGGNSLAPEPARGQLTEHGIPYPIVLRTYKSVQQESHTKVNNAPQQRGRPLRAGELSEFRASEVGLGNIPQIGRVIGLYRHFHIHTDRQLNITLSPARPGGPVVPSRAR